MPRVRKRQPTAFVQDRPSQRQVFWRRLRRSLTPALFGTAGLILLAGGAAATHALSDPEALRARLGDITGSLGLRVRDVVIEGRQKTPEAVLRAAIGVVTGDPILSYSVAAARARIETIRWVQAASVTRRLPDTIVVSLVERRPFAVWQHEGKFVLIDRDGQLVTDSDVGTFSSELPLVVGDGAPAAAATLIDELAAQPDIQARVQAAVRVGERRWNLRLSNGTDVLLPEGAEVQALARLAEMQTSHALLDRPLQALDLRLPDRLVFRPQPARGDDAKTQSPPARKPT